MRNIHLSEFTSEELAKELIARADFFEGPFLLPELYRLSIELGIQPCVDGIAVRKQNDGTIEALAIRRSTGPFAGKLCSVGGRILFEESFETAMRRHFLTDLGSPIDFITPWDKPASVYQFMRPQSDNTVLPDFGVDPTRRHDITIVYLVRLLNEQLTFGTTPLGTQEASDVEWFSLAKMPPLEEFGYGQGVYFKKCLEVAETFL
jgi:ADP-ribose pyrophosphatase YjhB (NUDIX family)